MKKKLLIAGLTSATILGSTMAGGAVLAHSNYKSDNFASAIATKFSLNKDDVQKFLDEQHQAHQADMEANFNSALDKAVTDGKITSEQKDKILTHRDETQSKREEIRKITDETQRREAMKQLLQDTKNWAQQNGIDMSKLDLPHPGHRRGPFGPREM